MALVLAGRSTVMPRAIASPAIAPPASATLATVVLASRIAVDAMGLNRLGAVLARRRVAALAVAGNSPLVVGLDFEDADRLAGQLLDRGDVFPVDAAWRW